MVDDVVVVVLIGQNIGHSLSPYLHGLLFDRAGVRGSYRLRETTTDVLRSTTTELRSPPYVGANVTSPFKESIIPCLDALSEAARTIQAVNTITIERGRLTGHNTDIVGIHAALAALALPERTSATILGTGGASRAAAAALLAMGCINTIEFRSRERARADAAAALFDDPRVRGRSLDAPLDRSLLINGTPVGRDDPERSPLLDDDLGRVKFLLDMNYMPAATRLMRQARNAGCLVGDGLTMFVEQGVRSFELWTGIAVDASGLLEAVNAERIRRQEARA